MMTPSLTFWKNPTAVAPKINKGLEAFENDNSRSASIREISFFFRSKTVIFAPDGKPLTMPNIQAKLPTPRTLNNGRMTGSNKTPKNWTIPKLVNSSAMMKKGSNDGKTISHQTFNPWTLAMRTCSGKETMANVKSKVK